MYQFTFGTYARQSGRSVPVALYEFVDLFRKLRASKKQWRYRQRNRERIHSWAANTTGDLFCIMARRLSGFESRGRLSGCAWAPKSALCRLY